MSAFWSATVRGLTPYIPGEQPRIDKLIKLNTNEHPYGPSPRALEAIRAEATERLRLYPDPSAEQLKAAIAHFHRGHSVTPEQIFVGNGSDEVLAHAFSALLKHSHPVWMPDISYSFYPVYCKLYDIELKAIPLDEHFGIRVQDYLPGKPGRAGGIVLANPNAPTGRLLPLGDIEQIVAGNPECVVLIDEAYIDFGGSSAVPLVARHPNLLVVHTLSKSRALAGLRVGFAVGHPALIEALERVKNSFNSYPLDRLALAGAIAAIADEDYFHDNCRKVIASREILAQQLALLGFDILPSTANFIFARHPAHDAAKLAAALRERAILVRHFAKPRIDSFLRITIGTPEQCDALSGALREIILSAHS